MPPSTFRLAPDSSPAWPKRSHPWAALRRKSEVTDEEIAAATAAYLRDENAAPFTFKSGHRIDVGKAIEMHPQAKKLLADDASSPGLRRTTVMTAVITGFPVQG